MLRRGEISRSLALFRSAASASFRLEAEKPGLRRRDADAIGRAAEYERVLDRAWSLVPRIEEASGPLAADIAAEHWLLGIAWLDVSVMHGISPDRCKKLALEAVKGLDG